jgi:hypothetical protein
MYPAREPAARGSRHLAGMLDDARARGLEVTVRPDDVPARRRRGLGPVAAGLGARRRERRPPWRSSATRPPGRA